VILEDEIFLLECGLVNGFKNQFYCIDVLQL